MRQGLALSVLLIASASCTSTPPQRHEYSLLLETIASTSTDSVEKTERLNIQRIDLPAFLQTRALAMQVNTNEIVLARHHAWTDRLDDSIARVLGLRLAEVRPQLEIVDATDSTCQLDIRFDRFHAAEKGKVLVSGQYKLSKDGVGVGNEFDVSRVLPVGGYGNAVSALRLAVVNLGVDIAASIEESGGCTSPASELDSAEAAAS